MIDDRPVTLYKGKYKKVASESEAIFMITGMTIGAGVLGLPYAISRLGLLPGLCYMLAIGAIAYALNRMIGEVAIQTGKNLQLPGLAGHYLGPVVQGILSFTTLVSAFGVLLAYMIGEGTALSALLGGNPFGWSVIFWSIGNTLIWAGLERVSKIEKIFSSIVMTIIVVLSVVLLPHVNTAELSVVHREHWLLPIGVILFAMRATPAVGEAHALLEGNPKKFRRALAIGTFLPLAIYILFTFAVVGASGSSTTEVATVGLGAIFGPVVGIFANIFAVLAMSTGFMGLGTALKETLVWDDKLPPWVATFFVAAVPLILFLLGLRNFISILEVIGGIFIGFEALVMIAVYIVASRQHRESFGLKNILFAAPVMLFFVLITGFNVYQLLVK